MIYDYPATLMTPEDVKDGDTVWLHVAMALDFGFHIITTNTARIKFRLARCNAPELPTLAGHAARQFTVDWLAEHANGLRVTSLRADKYGDRWDAEVWCSITSGNLSDALLASGNAIAYH